MKKTKTRNIRFGIGIAIYLIYWIMIIGLVFLAWLLSPRWFSALISAWVMYKFIHTDFFWKGLDEFVKEKHEKTNNRKG